MWAFSNGAERDCRKVKDFVRRRRWRRIRVPLDPEPCPPQESTADGGAASNGGGAAMPGSRSDLDLLYSSSPIQPSTQLHEALSFPSPAKALQAVRVPTSTHGALLL